MSSQWKNEFQSSLAEAIDTSASLYRIKDWSKLREDFALRALNWTLEQREIETDFLSFLKKLAYHVCVLPTQLPPDLQSPAFEVTSETALELPEIFETSVQEHLIAPLFFSKTFSLEKLTALVYLGAISKPYRGPVFFSKEAPQTLVRAKRGLPRQDKLSHISPGLEA